MMMKFLLFLLVCCLGSCTTEETIYDSHPHPAVYSMDNFSADTPPPQRAPKKLRFYFQDCSVTEGKSYYSKTSYACDDLNN